MGKSLEATDYVQQKLARYDWPGNVRELQNILERSVVMAHGNRIEDILLPEYEKNKEQTDKGSSIKTIDELERDHIIAILKRCNYRVSGTGGAAELLSLPPSTLFSKIKKFGIVLRQVE